MKYGLTQGQFDCKKVYLDYRLAMLEGNDLSGMLENIHTLCIFLTIFKGSFVSGSRMNPRSYKSRRVSFRVPLKLSYKTNRTS